MRIFVYGTLKDGFPNHRYLWGCRFIGIDAVNGKLYNLGAFPGLKASEDGRVSGEVWECPAKTTETLDFLEGHPTFYKREPTVTVGGIEVQTYYYQGACDERSRIESGNWEF